jgi:Protein of unknown function (DUF2550)
MQVVDAIGLVAVLLVVLLLSLLIARQRFMLRSAGGIAVAVRRGTRWQYGVARYQGDSLQWFRVLGIGTRPTRSLRRGELRVLSSHTATANDQAALPPTAVIVDCVDSVGPITIGLAESAYTGFVSWLESSAPRF